MNHKEKEWMKDFTEFVNSEEIAVPPALSEKIVSHVHKSLNPSIYLVFLKLLGVHAWGVFKLSSQNRV
jgi:hypothetical protein